MSGQLSFKELQKEVTRIWRNSEAKGRILCQLVVRERIGMSALSIESLLGELGGAAFFSMCLAVFFALLAFVRGRHICWIKVT